MGEGAGRRPVKWWTAFRITRYWLIPAAQAAEDVHAASDHELG